MRAAIKIRGFGFEEKGIYKQKNIGKPDVLTVL